MGSEFYGKLLPDYGDLDNETKSAPGYRVYIIEKDGGVSIQMIHAKENPVTTSGSAVFMNVQEAREMLQSLQEAIIRAESKNANHKSRGTDC